jgi:hypothetical protein
MTGRRFAALSLLLLSSNLIAQQPPQRPSPAIVFPPPPTHSGSNPNEPPRPQQLPPQTPPAGGNPATRPTLPYQPPLQIPPLQIPDRLPPSITNPELPPLEENLIPFDPTQVTIKKNVNRWQLWAGTQMLKELGPNEADAREALRVVRELRLTHYGRVGTPHPIMEYWLCPGQGTELRAPNTAAFPRTVLPFDVRSLKVEQVQGAWCVKDARKIVFNFGPFKADAEKAKQVCQRYGFNQIGIVGVPTPVMTYLFVGAEESPGANTPLGVAAAAAQQQQLARRGIEVPGIGFVGEAITIEPRRIELRKDRDGWFLAHGPELLARLGPSEWQSRDALRVAQEAGFTEFCRVGSNGFTFFLVRGGPPRNLPLGMHTQPFRADQLRAVQVGQTWVIADGGRTLFELGNNADEAAAIIAVIRQYGFDQVVRVGQSPTGGLRFLAKSR